MSKRLYVDTISWKSFFAVAGSRAKLIYEIDSKEKGNSQIKVKAGQKIIGKIKTSNK